MTTDNGGKTVVPGEDDERAAKSAECMARWKHAWKWDGPDGLLRRAKCATCGLVENRTKRFGGQ